MVGRPQQAPLTFCCQSPHEPDTSIGRCQPTLPEAYEVEGVLTGPRVVLGEQELPADAPMVRLRTIGLLSWAATKPKFLYEMPD